MGTYQEAWSFCNYCTTCIICSCSAPEEHFSNRVRNSGWILRMEITTSNTTNMSLKYAWLHVISVLCHLWRDSVFPDSNARHACWLCQCEYIDDNGRRCHAVRGRLLQCQDHKCFIALEIPEQANETLKLWICTVLHRQRVRVVELLWMVTFSTVSWLLTVYFYVARHLDVRYLRTSASWHGITVFMSEHPLHPLSIVFVSRIGSLPVEK